MTNRDHRPSLFHLPLRCAALALAGVAFTALPALGAGVSVYWDPNGVAGVGGTGNWDTSTANWSAVNTGTASTQTWVNANDDLATFLLSSNVTVTAPVSTSRLNFATNATQTFSIGNATATDIITLTNADDTVGLLVGKSGDTVNINAPIKFSNSTRIDFTGAASNVALNLNSTLTSTNTTTKSLKLLTSNSATVAINVSGNIIQGGTGALNLIVGTDANTVGTVTLSGANVYTGGTTFTAGTLIANSNTALGSGAVSVSSNNGTKSTNSVLIGVSGVTLNNAFNFAGNTIGNAADQLDTRVIGGSYTSGTSTFGGSVTVAAQAQATGLQVTSASGGRTNFTGNFLGAGNVTKVGGGVAALSATGSTNSGGFTVNAGTLLLNNASGSGTGVGAVAVANTGTLGGIGHIVPTGVNGLSVASGGTIAPGDGGIGTLELSLASTTGTATFAAGGLFSFDLGPSGASDLFSIIGTSSGDVTFNNNTINFNDLGIAPGTYTLFSFDSAGAYSGGLTIGTGLESFPGSSLLFNSNNIQLQVTAVPEPATWGLLTMASVGLLIIPAAKRRRS